MLLALILIVCGVYYVNSFVPVLHRSGILSSIERISGGKSDRQKNNLGGPFRCIGAIDSVRY